jgi:iron complex outermembrane receptor protein
LTESQAPDRQFFVHSSVDRPARLRLDAGLRAIGGIPRRQVPGYEELNAGLTWRPTAKLDLSIVGQNLLNPRHLEFGAPGPTRREIVRGVYGMVEWGF